MKLFCLPYAGGSSAMYYKWNKYLDKNIKLYAVELRGRGSRINELLYNNIEEAVDDIFNYIKGEIEEEYAIFGHSMGSILAYELYYKILDEKLDKPKHIFFSGQKSPNIARDDEKLSELGDEEFIDKVISLGGTPKEIIKDVDILNLFIPILKSDFKLLEKYHYIQGRNKIGCDVSILNGKKDDIKFNEIIEWQNQVSKECKIYEFNDGHFFINNEIETITDIINYTLLK